MLYRLLGSANVFGQLFLIFACLLWLLPQHVLRIQGISNLWGPLLFVVLAGYAMFFFRHTPLLRKHSVALFFFLLVVAAAGSLDLVQLGITFLVYAFLYESLALFDESGREVSFFSLGVYFVSMVLLEPRLFWYLPFLLVLFLSSKLSYANHFARFLIGLLLPLILVAELTYFFDFWPILKNHLAQAFGFHLPEMPAYAWMSLVSIFLLLLFGLFSHLGNNNFQKQSKKAQTDLLYLFLLNSFGLAFTGIALPFLLMLMAFALAICLGRYWQYTKVWWIKELVIWVYLAGWIGYIFTIKG